MTAESVDSEPEASSASWTFSALGTLASAIALISLIQSLFNIGLSPTFDLIVNSYRRAVAPVRHFLEWICGFLPMEWRPGEFYTDAFLLSAAGATIVARSYALKDRGSQRYTSMTLYLILLTPTLLGLSWLVMAPLFLFYRPFRKTDAQVREIRQIAKAVFAAEIAAAGFFALNAFSPS